MALLHAQLPRRAALVLQEYAQAFRVVAVTGPRQSGKSTLVRMVFPDKPYLSLEDLDVAMRAREDPRRFLSGFPDGAILDEVQRCPDLLSYLQGIVDADQRRGLFILTGSQDLMLMRGISQSLAGRVGQLTLLPLSADELAAAGRLPPTLDDGLFQGAFPEVHVHAMPPLAFYQSYLATYLERDLRNLLAVNDLATFQRFLRLCAGHIGQLVNASSLGTDCGISYNTVQSWLGLLQTCGLVVLLQPHHRNFNKRLIKAPKLYLSDTGLACRLLGITEVAQLSTHPLRGSLVECWAVMEFLKSRRHRGLDQNLFFWRNHTGVEIDLILDHGPTLLPVEIKSGETLLSEWADVLQTWGSWAGTNAEPGIIVYGGDRRLPMAGGITAIPWREIHSVAGLA